MGAETTLGFEGALRELERILAALEGDELRLDEALALFEEGVGHLRTANRFLAAARGRVDELIENAAGELQTVEFHDSAEDRSSEGGRGEDPGSTGDAD
ncbi:MAG: exodeoxyribonuclease VII small subunit [Gemmatimonadota bacterium]